MVVIVFRARVKPGVEADYMTVGMRMIELAQKMPGFISQKSYGAEDGEWVTIVEFESEEQLRAWREHPEHRAAQQQGRDTFYAEYRIQVCTLVRESKFKAAA
jgi:heme-degrading monooxygenase HmoA